MPTKPMVPRYKSRYFHLLDAPTFPSGLGKLTWKPPTLVNPITVDVPTGATLAPLDDTKDYILKMPVAALARTLVIQGGRNVVVIGGEVNNANATASDGSQKNAGVYVNNVKGTCHLEGLKLRGSGLRDGFVLNCPSAGSRVVMQNCSVEEIYATDETGFTDIHPDNIQTIAGPSQLWIDRFSGVFIYQAFYDQPEAIGGFQLLPYLDGTGRILTNMDFRLRADRQAANLGSGGLPFYKNYASNRLVPVYTSNVWIDGGPITPPFRYLYPGYDLFGRGIRYGSGVRPQAINGADAATNRFVTSSGLAYVSPGYVGS